MLDVSPSVETPESVRCCQIGHRSESGRRRSEPSPQQTRQATGAAPLTKTGTPAAVWCSRLLHIGPPVRWSPRRPAPPGRLLRPVRRRRREVFQFHPRPVRRTAEWAQSGPSKGRTMGAPPDWNTKLASGGRPIHRRNTAPAAAASGGLPSARTPVRFWAIAHAHIPRIPLGRLTVFGASLQNVPLWQTRPARRWYFHWYMLR